MDSLIRKVAALADKVTGAVPGPVIGTRLPTIRILVLGANGAGKTTIIRTYCDRRKQSGAGQGSTAEIERTTVTLEQRERKWLPLTAEYALRSGQEQTHAKGYWKKGEGLRFRVEFIEVPMSDVHDEVGGVHDVFANSHACILVVDSLRPLTVRGAMRWAAVCDRIWEGRGVPRVLALHKIDAGRTLIPSDALAGLLQTCGSARCSKTSTAGLSVPDMVHQLLDDVLNLEVQRMGVDACQVDWLVGHRELGQDMQEEELSVEQENYLGASLPLRSPDLPGEQSDSGGNSPREYRPRLSAAMGMAIQEMYFANEKKPTSISSAEESDMGAWVGGSVSPESNVESMVARREQRRDLKRIMKSIVKYYEGLQAQLARIRDDTGEERAAEFETHAKRSAVEYQRLSELLERCSRSSDDSSGSSSSGTVADTGEAASFDELTAQLVANQRKWGRLLDAYETELRLIRAEPAVSEAPPPAHSPGGRLPMTRCQSAAVDQEGRQSPSPGRGFSFRHTTARERQGSKNLVVNNGSSPLILRTRCESL